MQRRSITHYYLFRELVNACEGVIAQRGQEQRYIAYVLQCAKGSALEEDEEETLQSVIVWLAIFSLNIFVQYHARQCLANGLCWIVTVRPQSIAMSA